MEAETISTQRRNDIQYIYFLRVAASIAVIVIHVVAKDFTVPPVTSLKWQCLNVFEFLSRWSVPVFVMISGALFLDNAKPLSLKKLYGKHILRIVIALVFWSAVYAVAYQYIYMGNGLMAVLDEFWQGADHLWYLYMITGLYVLCPLFRCITRNVDSAVYFLLLFLIVQLNIPEFIGGSRLGYTFQRFELNMVLGYGGYFVAGYVLNTIEIKKPIRYTLYTLGVAATLAAIFISSFLSVSQGCVNMECYDYFWVFVMIQSAAVFVFFRYEIGKIRPGKVIVALSKYSFGIYLSHQIFVDGLRRFFGLNTQDMNALVAVPLITILSLAMSASFTAIAIRIPILKKLV